MFHNLLKTVLPSILGNIISRWFGAPCSGHWFSFCTSQLRGGANVSIVRIPINRTRKLAVPLNLEVSIFYLPCCEPLECLVGVCSCLAGQY